MFVIVGNDNLYDGIKDMSIGRGDKGN